MRLLAAKFRTSSVDDSVAEVERIVAHIRTRWPATAIVIRADSGFCRDDLMTWCEANNVQYVLGLAGNKRLVARNAPEMKATARTAKRTGQPARVFVDFRWRTHKSWSAERCVIGKAEYTNGEANPRFIVTKIVAPDQAAQPADSTVTGSATTGSALGAPSLKPRPRY